MKTLLFRLSFVLIFTLSACATSPVVDRVADNRIHVTILHFNDIYEIMPVSGGKEGGIARVATLRKQLLARNPNTITTLGGDLFSPSAIGTAQYQGDRLAGRQMVDVLNHFKLDYATFGNHEFDLSENQFRQRMQEAQFTWISSNVFDAEGRPFDTVKKHLVVPFADKKTGNTFNIGLFGLILAANKATYVRYGDPFAAAGEQIAQLTQAGQKADFIIALTHQAIGDDVQLLQDYPQIGLLLGGHEHVNYQYWRGDFVPLLKGDANVRSVYVIDLYFDPVTGGTEVKPAFVPIDDTFAEDAALKAVVDHWMTIAFDAFRQQGFQPEAVVTVTTEALDGLESHVRSGATNLTERIARSMLLPYPQAELSVYNSGSIRIDDILPAGKITVYDVIRILPFGGLVQLAEIRGDLLIKLLDEGLARKGSGGYLQSANTRRENNVWYVNASPIQTDKVYPLALNDYLTSGKARGLEFLKDGGSGFRILDDGKRNDIRQTLIDALKDR